MLCLQARGEMQLAVVIESLRREGMELAVSPPQVVYRWGSIMMSSGACRTATLLYERCMLPPCILQTVCPLVWLSVLH